MYTTASRRCKYKVGEVAKVRFSKFQLAKSGLNETTRSQQLHWLTYHLFSYFWLLKLGSLFLADRETLCTVLKMDNIWHRSEETVSNIP